MFRNNICLTLLKDLRQYELGVWFEEILSSKPRSIGRSTKQIQFYISAESSGGVISNTEIASSIFEMVLSRAWQPQYMRP